MAIDLYYMPASAPCRSIIMLAKELGIEFNLKHLDLHNGEHLKPEFVAINPQHCIPTLVDDGFVLWESRAVLQYLANKTNSNLYPTDPKKRAVVDRLLYFDLGTLFKAIGEYAYPQLFAKQPADEEKLKKIKETLVFLDGFLEGIPYVAGESLTIADLSILATLSFIEVVLDFDFSEHKNVAQWLTKLKGELSYYKEVNEEPLKQFKEFIGK